MKKGGIKKLHDLAHHSLYLKKKQKEKITANFSRRIRQENRFTYESMLSIVLESSFKWLIKSVNCSPAPSRGRHRLLGTVFYRQSFTVLSLNRSSVIESRKLHGLNATPIVEFVSRFFLPKFKHLWVFNIVLCMTRFSWHLITVVPNHQT